MKRILSVMTFERKSSAMTSAEMTSEGDEATSVRPMEEFRSSPAEESVMRSAAMRVITVTIIAAVPITIAAV